MMFKLLCLLLTLAASVAAKPALFEENRWYTLLSTGTASSSGPYEMSNFYEPTFTASVEFGYDITDHLAIVPINCAFHGFSFSKQAYFDNYSNYRGEYQRIARENSPYYSMTLLAFSMRKDVLTDFKISSNLTGFSYTPGIRFTLPLHAGLNATFMTGAGIYSTRGSMKYLYIYSNPTTGEITDNEYYDDRTRITHFTALIGAGVEYLLANRVGINLRLNYQRIFTGRNSDTPFNFEVLKFYHLDNDELKYHRFLEEKDTGILELSLGCRILMY